MTQKLMYLDQFIGHKVFLMHEDKNERSIAYQYDKFNYDFESDGNLTIKDDSQLLCKTRIPSDEITEITNETESVYSTTVFITYGDNDIIIFCANDEPEKCDRCHRIFKESNQIWAVNQEGSYFSKFDGDKIHKKFCDNCIVEICNDSSSKGGETNE